MKTWKWISRIFFHLPLKPSIDLCSYALTIAWINKDGRHVPTSSHKNYKNEAKVVIGGGGVEPRYRVPYSRPPNHGCQSWRLSPFL